MTLRIFIYLLEKAGFKIESMGNLLNIFYKGKKCGSIHRNANDLDLYSPLYLGLADTYDVEHGSFLTKYFEDLKHIVRIEKAERLAYVYNRELVKLLNEYIETYEKKKNIASSN